MYLASERDLPRECHILSDRFAQWEGEEGGDNRHPGTRPILGCGPLRNMEVNSRGGEELILRELVCQKALSGVCVCVCVECVWCVCVWSVCGAWSVCGVEWSVCGVEWSVCGVCVCVCVCVWSGGCHVYIHTSTSSLTVYLSIRVCNLSRLFHHITKLPRW